MKTSNQSFLNHSLFGIFVLCLMSSTTIFTFAQTTICFDPLTSSELTQSETPWKSKGGIFTEKGWKAVNDGDYLFIELATGTGFEGQLEVDVTELDWQKSNTTSNNEKIHFLSMFSNPVADHHVEQGGTEKDALWSLRGGKGDNGEPRYGQNFKVLWASKGAKRTPMSDYSEKTITMPDGWKWDKPVYTFTIRWSLKQKKIDVSVNGLQVFEGPWLNQISPLKYIYIAKSPDFGSFIGPVFSNLRVTTGEIQAQQ